MKRYCTLLLVVVMLCSLVACNQTENTPASIGSSASMQTPPSSKPSTPTTQGSETSTPPTQGDEVILPPTTQGGETTEPPATQTTNPPATQNPITPTTNPPATQAPATTPPATQPPATQPSATQPVIPPTTIPQATEPPATKPPKTTKTVYLMTRMDNPDEIEIFNYDTRGYLVEYIWVDSAGENPSSVIGYTDEGFPLELGGYSYFYDKDCNVIGRTSSSAVEEFAYDEDGFRIYYKRDSLREGLSSVEYYYTKNEKGLIATKKGSSGTTYYTYTYNASGMPSIMKATNASGESVYKYFYDEAGNIIKIETTDVAGTWETHYTYQAIELPLDSKLDQMDMRIYYQGIYYMPEHYWAWWEGPPVDLLCQ